MKLLKRAVFGLILSTALATPGFAIEPDAPERLITRLDAIGVEVQKQLATSFRSEATHQKRERGALVEFYSEADTGPIWVGETRLNDKAAKLIAELGRADQYGLNPKDYDLKGLSDLAADGGHSSRQPARRSTVPGVPVSGPGTC